MFEILILKMVLISVIDRYNLSDLKAVLALHSRSEKY